jgi:hypothetical protein
MKATMIQTDMEFIELFRSVDDASKEMMLDALICCVAFGNEFLEAWKSAIDSGSREVMLGKLEEWRAKVER